MKRVCPLIPILIRCECLVVFIFFTDFHVCSFLNFLKLSEAEMTDEIESEEEETVQEKKIRLAKNLIEEIEKRNLNHPLLVIILIVFYLFTFLREAKRRCHRIR